MLTYDEALSRILTPLTPLPSERQALLDSLGCALAEPVTAAVDLPPFANSQMDGYAVIASDLAGSSPSTPVRLRVVGEIAAGHAPGVTVASGDAAKIFTGAAMPDGADTVVPVEDTTALGDGAVMIAVAVEARQFVRPAGQDARRGDVVLDAGQIMTPGAIALASSAGASSVAVTRPVRVCIISTGDELVRPGETLGPGQIYESNSLALAAQVRECGATLVASIHARDSAASLRDALDAAEASEAGVIISSGGVSVGDHDLVKAVFGERGSVDFWRVAIRPGKPFAFGTWGSRLFFGLPGNPASAMVTFELFVRPAIRALAGISPPTRPLVAANLGAPVKHEPGRRSFMRAVTQYERGRYVTLASSRQASHLLRPLASANSLLIVPEDVDGIVAGASVDVMLLG